jgi:RNA polymerase sigma-70 factor, ECF subfamily
MKDESDWELVARARTGEMDAFALLVQRYEQPAIHFCLRMVGSFEDAEDLAQEAFVRVYRHLARLKPEAKFSTVLFGIARNLTLNHLRDGRRRGRDMAQSLTHDDESERLVADDERRPDRQARLQEIETLIAQALERLSPDHREMVILRELQGLDYEAIAEITNTPKGTVKSRLARARCQLKLQLEELGGKAL